ncbi:universal stress protein [Gordonia rhizosphera]|uniref:Usp family protein n=1 Tax=Gordonia rhizosphera NBRC 16068 TaxID=1108045 RepID=K6X4W4_9ACTN|nr:universal stress protein [Gordonia rhizosphera]GAB93799.1 Usp family protein [Gordonia rhizosphera NBRC 16068]
MTVVMSYVATIEGRGALPFGFREARMRDTDLVIVADGESASDPEFLVDLETARKTADACDVKYRVAETDSALSHADQLIDASYDDSIELLVVGMKRRSPVGKLLTGSFVQRVLLDAQCPVAAVKPPVRAAV